MKLSNNSPLKHPPCPIQGHSKQPLTHACLDSACIKTPLSCYECIQASHKNHSIIPIKTLNEEIENLKFDGSISQLITKHNVDLKNIKARCSEVFTQTRQKMTDRLNELETAVVEYLDGVDSEIQAETTKFSQNSELVLICNADDSDEVAIECAGQILTKHVANKSRMTELSVLIPTQTNKVKASISKVQCYLQRISNQDSNNIRAFQNWMVENGHIKGKIYAQKPTYNNSQLLQQMMHADLGKGPQKTPTSMWKSFGRDNKSFIYILIAVIGFILAVGFKNMFTPSVIHIKEWNLAGLHKDITVNKKMISTNGQLSEGASCAALNISLNSTSDVIYSIQIMAITLNQKIGLGICDRISLNRTSYTFDPLKVASSGCYSAFSDGKLYSSWDMRTQNKNYSWRIGAGDVFRMEYRPRKLLASFYLNNQHISDLHVIRPVRLQYVPYICLFPSKSASKVSII